MPEGARGAACGPRRRLRAEVTGAVAAARCDNALRRPVPDAGAIPGERAAGAINSTVVGNRPPGAGERPRQTRAPGARMAARSAQRCASSRPSSRRRWLVAAGRAIRAVCCAAPGGAARGAPRSGAPLRRAHVAHAGGLPATRRAATARGVALRPSLQPGRDSVVRSALEGG